jgi:ATP-dependent protease ClpP protease subunit
MKRQNNSTDFHWGSRSHKRLRPSASSCDDESDESSQQFNHHSSKIWCDGNHIYFNCCVDDSSIGELIKIINEKNFEFKLIRSHELVKDIEPNPVYLHINSDGGEIFPALWAVDVIKSSLVPIYTIVNGRTASAGTIISIVGARRFMTKHSYMLIHQLRSGVVGKYNDIKQEYQNCNLLMENIVQIYTTHSKITLEEATKMLDHDQYWNLETCLKHGIVDEEWTENKQEMGNLLESFMTDLKHQINEHNTGDNNTGDNNEEEINTDSDNSSDGEESEN